MAKITNAIFRGKSGKEYSFGVYSTNSIFQNTGAVYIFSKRTIEDNIRSHELLYIAQTDKLMDSIITHEKWDCVNEFGVNCICVHMDNNLLSRFDKETDLRDKFQTPCNG